MDFNCCLQRLGLKVSNFSVNWVQLLVLHLWRIWCFFWFNLTLWTDNLCNYRMAYPSYATLNNGYKQQRNHRHMPQTNPRISGRRGLHRNMNNNQKISDILYGAERPRLKIATNGLFVDRNNNKRPRDVFKKPQDPPRAKKQTVFMETSFLNVYPDEYSLDPPSPVIQVPPSASPSSPPSYSPPPDSHKMMNTLLNCGHRQRSNTMDYLNEVKQYILRTAKKNRRKPMCEDKFFYFLPKNWYW